MSEPRLLSPSGLAQNSDLMSLRSTVLSNRVVMSSGQIGFRGTGGIVSRSSSGFSTRPFNRAPVKRTLFVKKASTPTTAKVSVTFGQINGETPKIGGAYLNADPAPKLTVITGDIFLHATVDEDSSITALTIENAAERPEDTETDGYLTLATVTVEDDVITALDHAAWNLLQMGKCGSTVYQWGGFGE